MSSQLPLGGNLAQTPAVAYYPYYGQFHVVGLGTDGNLWDDYYTTTWVGWTVVPAPTPVSGGFNSAPAIAVWNNQFHVFARGASTHHIYHAWYDPATGWNGWADISNAPSATAPSATAYTGTGNRDSLHVFYLTDDGSQNMMQLVYNNPGSPNQWIGPIEQEAGPWASTPVVAQYSYQFQVWVVGTDGRLYQIVYDPYAGWLAPTTIGSDADLVGSAPAVMQYNNQFQIFYVMGDAAGTWDMHQLYYDPTSGWNGPSDVGWITSAPAVAQYNGQLQVWSRDAQGAGPGATSCAHGRNLGDTACVNGHNGEKYTASEALWADNHLNVVWDPQNPYRFMGNAMWMYTRTDLRTFVEVGNNFGTCYGPWGRGEINVCPQGTDPTHPHAFRYWFDGKGNSYWMHWVDWWTTDYYQHDFLLQRDPNNPCNWFVYVDALYRGTSTVQYCSGGLSYGYEDQVGLENNGYVPIQAPPFYTVQEYTDLYYSDTVSDEQLRTWHDGAWHPWEYQYSYNNDEPCNSRYTTNCYNGNNYNDNTTWFANRLWDRGP
ncbi:MAG: hypothetical protein JOZ41_13170 [Chloroflexi bacterium]|nr:hypothetical protein [Chloroflexota bacterium]